jgi:aminoglycoside phosphotransferase (APT) family kinase protein
VIAADHQAVRSVLHRVWPEPSTVETAEIRALGGGLNVRSYLVAAGERRHVLRLPVANAVAWLDLATEVRAMKAAAAADLAPRVIAADLAAGLLLTDYGATAWTPELARRPAAVTRVARLLRTLHRVGVELPVYSVSGFATTYLAALRGERTRPSSAEEERWAGELATLGAEFDSEHPPTAFCHNDLAAANILADAAAARLIDFEYAGRGAPLLDLASFAGMNGLAKPQRRQLLDEYYGTASAAPTMRDLDNAIRIVWLLAYFWGRVAEVRLADARAHTELVANFGELLRQD